MLIPCHSSLQNGICILRFPFLPTDSNHERVEGGAILAGKTILETRHAVLYDHKMELDLSGDRMGFHLLQYQTIPFNVFFSCKVIRVYVYGPFPLLLSAFLPRQLTPRKLLISSLANHKHMRQNWKRRHRVRQQWRRCCHDQP